MYVEITSGNRLYKIRISNNAEIKILKPKGLAAMGDVSSELKNTLLRFANEKGMHVFSRPVAPRRIALVVADDVVPDYLEIILPELLDQLTALWPAIKPSMITIIVRKRNGRIPGTGKFQSVLRTQALRGVHVISHDPVLSRVTDFGATTQGTPVLINSDLADADLKFFIGQLYPHQLIGFTGAANAVASACAGAETLEAMTRLMLQNKSRPGCLTAHPLRMDLAEVFRMAGINPAVSLILNPGKKPVRFLIGDPESVLTEGARICMDHFGICVPSRFDIVVAACGEKFPHHCRKTLLMTSQVVKEGGKVLILAGKNSRDVGNDIYFNYVCQSMCPEALMDAFRASGIQLDKGEVDLLEQSLINKEIDLTMRFDQEISDKCQFRAADPTAVIEEWIGQFQGRPQIAVIPDEGAMCCFTG